MKAPATVPGGHEVETATKPPAPPAQAHNRTRDAWASGEGQTASEIEALCEILELRGGQPRQVHMRENCFHAAGIVPGMKVIEFGCGSGVVARHLAKMVGPGGHVVGVDVNTDFVRYAMRINRTDPTIAPIDYLVADAQEPVRLGHRFDAALAVTLLAHVKDPLKVVATMANSLDHGARLVLLDQDYRTLVFEHDDLDLSHRILNFGAQTNVLRPFVGRSLAGLLARVGLEKVQTWSFVYAERDSDSYLMTIAERFVVAAVKHGVITAMEGSRWLENLRERSRDGTFFASMNYICAWANVP